MSARAAAALNAIERHSGKMVIHGLNSGDGEGAHIASNTALGGTPQYQGGPETVVSMLLKAKVSSVDPAKRNSVQLLSRALMGLDSHMRVFYIMYLCIYFKGARLLIPDQVCGRDKSRTSMTGHSILPS